MSIQDYVFNTVYWFSKSAWKNAWKWMFNSVPITIPFFQWKWWELSFFWSNFENMDGTFEWLKGYMYTFGTKIHVFLKWGMLCNDISCIDCVLNKIKRKEARSLKSQDGFFNKSTYIWYIMSPHVFLCAYNRGLKNAKTKENWIVSDNRNKEKWTQWDEESTYTWVIITHLLCANYLKVNVKSIDVMM